MDAARAKGRPLPDWYLAEPELQPGDAFYLRAWHDLSTCRSIGMDLGPIPWTAILAYSHHLGLCDSMVETLALIVRQMDEAYREWHREESERQRKKNNPR